MDRILTNHQIPGQIIDLIEESKEYCFLVTPYFKPWNLLYRSLEKAAKQEKKIIFVFRAGNNMSPEMEALNRQYGFDVFFIDRLHTKLYFNESKVLITSMNLYYSSKENNYEVGYILKGSGYARKFKEKIIENDIISLEPAFLLKGRYLEELERKQHKNNNKQNVYDQNYNNKGYCIRCSRPINQNIHCPLCEDCYEIWSQFSNPYYTENYCHICGEEAPTSKKQPLCEDCFQKSKNSNVIL